MAIKTITLAEARNIIVNKWDIERLDAAEQTAKEVSEFMPCTITIDIHEYESGATELHNTHVTIQAEPFPIHIHYWQYEKKYVISPDFKALKNVDTTYNEISRIGGATPIKIGKLSLKKINDWINYYTKVYEVLKATNDKNVDTIADFRKSLEGLPVKWFDENQTSGEMVCNGIRYKFSIEKSYVSQTIEVMYNVPNTLDSFIRLSDNKYIQPPKK